MSRGTWPAAHDQMRGVVDELRTGQQRYVDEGILPHPLARRAAAAVLDAVVDAIDDLDRVFAGDSGPIEDEEAWVQARLSSCSPSAAPPASCRAGTSGAPSTPWSSAWRTAW